MNFFSHGYRWIDRPYFMAGVCVPDWLSYIDRKIRARERLAQPYVSDVDPLVSEVAKGVVQHHRDDYAFHTSRVFVELEMEMALNLRDRLVGDDGLRPKFVGHIVIEMLLDSYLHESLPGRLEAYYLALKSIDLGNVQSAVNRITGKPTNQLKMVIEKFTDSPFLYDYTDDAKLLYRVNQVMHRIGLDQLPDSIVDFVAFARGRTFENATELLATATLKDKNQN